MGHHRIERGRKINVVAIDECDNVAGRSFESLIDRVDLPAIFFTFPVCESMFGDDA
jgi:hypothetical protein